MIKSRKYRRIFSLILIVVFMFNTNVFASNLDLTEQNDFQSIDEVKEYLTNYTKVETNEYGKEVRTHFCFESEEDKNTIAAYILENGLDKFNEELDQAIAAEVADDPKPIITRNANPNIVYKTVYGNGNHYVSEHVYGLASFSTLGTTEYSVQLGYTAVVSGGRFTSVNGISLSFPSMGAATTAGDFQFPTFVTDNSCGVTAIYTLTKRIGVEVSGYPIGMEAETDIDTLAINTHLG